MKLAHLTWLSLILLGCGKDAPTFEPVPARTATAQVPAQAEVSFADARRGFKTKLIRKESAKEPVKAVAASVARIVHFESSVGPLAAYLTIAPKDGKRRPAMIWITGGDCNTIDGALFQPAPPENDQTAAAFRLAGIVTMFPSLRGGNNNPGVREGFLGEVDDVIAAADWLAKQEGVDPERIYLGGHSTGGTLVLLVACATDRFRAVFSFGPVDDVRDYDDEFVPFDRRNPREFDIRQPSRWLHCVKKPLFVFEGANQPGNVASLNALKFVAQNPAVRIHTVPGKDHFSVLQPVTRLTAAKILRDQGPTCNIVFTEAELR